MNWAVAQGAQVIELDVRPTNADGQYPLTVMAINAAIAQKKIVVIPIFGCTMCAKTYLELNADPKAIFVAGTSVAVTKWGNTSEKAWPERRKE